MRNFLEYLSSGRTLVGPVFTGKVVENRVAMSSEILMDDRIAYNSIKAHYFPQSELMFTFSNDEITDNSDISGYVIFGARPCDLEALRVMSIVYTSGKYADPFFQRRFDANFIIGVGCQKQKPGCFCTEMGVDAEFSDFCDIMLIDHDGHYTVEHLSEKGQNALNGYPPTSGIECSNERTANASSENMIVFDVDEDDALFFDAIDWAKVTETCKGCGICTYICPTCYCFDFKDVSNKNDAKRFKCWDSCMSPKFTLHASGHNPREHLYERYRQRVLHKYKYVPSNFDGCVACTGCGRCIRSCPVGINIREIARQVMSAMPST